MLLLVVIGLIVMALIGAPLFTIFGAASITLFLSRPEGTWASVAIDVFSSKFAESPNLMMIPLFTFAGFMLAEANTPRRLVRVSRAWLGWMPGSLAMVCLGASAFFTTFTGGSGVTIVAVGGLLFPALLSDKYTEKFSLGLITTAGSLGILFPPSVPLILYGIVASLAGAGLIMNKVLVAGLVPGFIVVLILSIYAAYTGVKTNLPRNPFVAKEAFAALWEAKWEVAIPLVLIVGLLLGLFRIHEASAFTAIYVLFIEVFVYRDIGIRKDLPRIVIESMTMVGAILAILATAVGFTGWMIQAQVATILVEWMDSFVSSKLVFLLVLNGFLLMVGMLMDIFTATMVVVPLILPLAFHYGVDPYHLACIFLLNLEIGYLTPPLGMNLYISSIRFSRPFVYVCRTVLPFIGVLFIALGLVTYVPIFSTWLPGLIKVDEQEDGYVIPEISTGEEEMAEELPELDEDLGFETDGGLDELDDLLDDESDGGLSGLDGGVDASDGSASEK